jgi:hypothetical protein
MCTHTRPVCHLPRALAIAVVVCCTQARRPLLQPAARSHAPLPYHRHVLVLFALPADCCMLLPLLLPLLQACRTSAPGVACPSEPPVPSARSYWCPTSAAWRARGARLHLCGRDPSRLFPSRPLFLSRPRPLSPFARPFKFARRRLWRSGGQLSPTNKKRHIWASEPLSWHARRRRRWFLFLHNASRV